MYQEGQLIVYGTLGVCRVKGVVSRSQPGSSEKQDYYAIQPLYQSCSIFAPVDGDKVFMRPVISREEAERLIDTIPTLQAEAFHGKALSELAEHYRGLINSHECEDLIEMTMSIYAKKIFVEQQKRRFGTVDERYMKRAEELLFGELAAALDIPIEEVPAYIANRVGPLESGAFSGE